MPRLTLRTLLAYIDDVLDPDQARALGRKVAESDEAKQLIERIKKVTRRRGLRTPIPDGSDDDVSDPNTVAEYLSDTLSSDQLKQLESTCLESDVHLAEVAACHQILTLVLTEPVRVPPSANQRMYHLVEPPASDHRRKPGKAIPVGGVTPPTSDQTEADDPDAALLLGMKRYSTTESWAGRLGLVGAVAGLMVILALAIWTSMPPAPTEPPKSSPGPAYALAGPAPGPASKPVTGTTPVTAPATTPGTTPVAGVEVAPEPRVVAVVSDLPELGGKIPMPLPGRGVLGKMETPNVIVLSRPQDPKADWTRVSPATPEVVASDSLMVLPGYKAKVDLASGVVVHLWGNLPQQVPTKPLVMQSRIQLHPPPEGFDADLRLEEGRIYLSTTKAGGSRVRVRLATEVWDVLLPNKTSEVLVQSHVAFVPGTPYAREGGDKPRTEASFVVTQGTASFNAPGRSKKFDSVPQWSQIAWNSKTDTLADPVPLPKDAQGLIGRIDSLTAIPGPLGEAIQRVLSDAASELTNPTGIRILLEGRMDSDGPDQLMRKEQAIYSYGTILDGVDRDRLHVMLARLWDRLRGSDVYPRQAAASALSTWLPRDVKNTAMFVEFLTNPPWRIDPDEANLIAQLLRGYSSPTVGPTRGDVAKFEELIKFLDYREYRSLVVRELALGNLIASYYVEAEAAKVVPWPPPITDVSNPGPEYDKFLKDWETRAAQIKKWMMDMDKDKKK